MAKTVVGQTFRAETGQRFKVVVDRFFAAGTHDKVNGRYLDALRVGFLVSVAYHGVSTPLVTLKGGVAKLGEIEIAGKRLKGAGKISSALGVGKTRNPVKLEKA